MREVGRPEALDCTVHSGREALPLVHGPTLTAFGGVTRLPLLHLDDDGRCERDEEEEVDEHARSAVDAEAAQRRDVVDDVREDSDGRRATRHEDRQRAVREHLESGALQRDIALLALRLFLEIVHYEDAAGGDGDHEQAGHDVHEGEERKTEDDHIKEVRNDDRETNVQKGRRHEHDRTEIEEE